VSRRDPVDRLLAIIGTALVVVGSVLGIVAALVVIVREGVRLLG
jgi:hypothetical protein